jgi:hypothetical protein
LYLHRSLLARLIVEPWPWKAPAERAFSSTAIERVPPDSHWPRRDPAKTLYLAAILGSSAGPAAGWRQVWRRAASGRSPTNRFCEGGRSAMKALFGIYLGGIVLAISYFAIIGLGHH